ncbi:MAG: T9SS type A sorting domain-containing protein [Flavobacterium sp.]|nr:MAG: T9SS type A sorting domain-containing protein [Flavobacterium sp.]
MKRNTVKMFVLALALTGGVSGWAQTAEQRKQITKDYDKAELDRYAKMYAEMAKQDKEYALALAPVKGWPLTFTTEDGATAELMGVHANGKPHYYVTNNVQAAFTSRISSLNSGGDLGLNLNGEDMLIGMWDQQSPRIAHNTFGGRVSILDNALQITNHPTHVFGTMLGTGVGSVNTGAKGMAPLAQGSAYNWDFDVVEMSNEASGGLLVSNHSYGSFAANLDEWEFGAYTGKAVQYDQVAFAAKNYLIVQAAGNDRGSQFNSSKGGYDLINGSKTAKNAVTVAAVFGLNSEYSGPSSVVMSPFSSYGPTDDNRVKPDISAKGVSVYSSIVNGTSNSTYGNLDGTSMASPVVAGGSILLQQHYFNVNGDFMRSATLRGLICHTADEAGDWDGPDGRFGWGLFNARKAAQAISGNGATSLIEQRSLSQNQTYTKVVNAQAGQKLQVSICWTDPAGPSGNGQVDSPSPVLVNDLDVRVTKSGTTYLPYKLGATYTAAAVKADNNVDNVERIDVAGATGQYTITVSHKGGISQGPQQYTLIVTGITGTPGGIEDNAKNLFTVWPNPASSVLNISMETGLDNNAAYVIYDVQGRQVMAGPVSETSAVVDIAGLSNGIYMVKVANGAKEQVSKIVVNK